MTAISDDFEFPGNVPVPTAIRVGLGAASLHNISSPGVAPEMLASADGTLAMCSAELGIASPDTTTEQAERPLGFTELLGIFEGTLSEKGIERLQSLTENERTMFLTIAEQVYLRNKGRPNTMLKQMQRLDCFMRGLSLHDTARVTCVKPETLRTGIKGLPVIFGREAQTIRQAIGEPEPDPQQTIVNVKKPEPQWDAEELDVIQSVGKLVRHKDATYEGINALARHLLGKVVDTDSYDFETTTRAMRRTIDNAVNRLRSYRPDSQAGLMTRQDARLFFYLLGNPEKDLMPATLKETKDRIDEETLGPNRSMVEMRKLSVGALQRLARTL